MRKLMTVLAFVALVMVVAAPTMAQQATLSEFLVNDGRFGTLLDAVGAAGLSDALNSDGPLTVLAPTDDAFAALPLGALDYLLNNPELLTQVLSAHVIPGKYTLRQLVSGPTLDSAGGEPITFALSGGLLAANGATISSVDQVTSNGVVQVLDSVIVPSAVSEALAAATSYLRVGHFSPDGGAVDITVDDQKVLEGVTFGTISDWLPLVEGVYTVQLAPAGSDNFIRTTTTRIPGGAHITAAAIGVAGSGDLALQFIPEDYSPIASGQARVTIFHAIQNAPAVDVLVNGGVMIRLLGYPATLGNNDGVDTVNITAGGYDIQLVPSGATTPVILDLPNVRFNEGTNYFVAAIGTPTNPTVAVAATGPDMAQ
ncbi:MAG: fasciclin domain-containing protein [Anaerolineae bacterium]|nr:fasciclin domain-containing protein [Anaerolineae bacterium]